MRIKDLPISDTTLVSVWYPEWFEEIEDTDREYLIEEKPFKRVLTAGYGELEISNISPVQSSDGKYSVIEIEVYSS